MARHFPIVAIALGIAGLVPFIACGVASLSALPQQAGMAVLALIGYGAIILGFLGGVHWGLALEAAPAVTDTANRGRYVLGVLPSLAGWAALLLAVADATWAGLALLIAAFVAVTAIEVRAERLGLLPRSYLWLRGGLSAVVVLTLGCVLLLRLAGVQATL